MAYGYRLSTFIYIYIYGSTRQEKSNINFMHIIFILNIKEIHILTYLSVIRMNYNITISVPGLNFCKFVNDSQN